MAQTQLWELANYTLKPRLNRVNGVSMVVLQGGQVPEFHILKDFFVLSCFRVFVIERWLRRQM
jgi:Cu/Ag efflux pump CusA